MPNPIQDKVRNAMQTGGTLNLDFDARLNEKSPGKLTVYLHETDNGATVRVDLNQNGESAEILWLPWKQGHIKILNPLSVSGAPAGMLFLTYRLTGCKVFAIRGGPICHIDATIDPTEFWPYIMETDWVLDNWTSGSQDVMYLHRKGQDPKFWDLSAYLQGAAPTTYGQGNNLGQAIVGGVVGVANNEKVIDLYMKASPWCSLKYTAQRLKKK